MINELEMKVTMTRKDLCDLLIATTALDEYGAKWGKLHDKLREQLQEFDKELGFDD